MGKDFKTVMDDVMKGLDELRKDERGRHKSLRKVFIEKGFIPPGTSHEDMRYLRKFDSQRRARQRREERVRDELWVEKMRRADAAKNKIGNSGPEK